MGGSGRDRDRRGGGDRDGWDGKGRKDKDELVDGSLVELLRRGGHSAVLSSGPLALTIIYRFW
jgi:hypothetical protein